MARVAHVAIAGSVAVVTGAGGGIGRATAVALAARGAAVLCADIRPAEAEKAAAACAEAGAPATGAYAVDVADRGAMEQFAAHVAGEHGAVGILVNNAGVGMSGSFAAMSAADWAWIRGINLDGVVNGCAVFGPAMLAAGRGHVVNVSSGLAFLPSGNEVAYGTTKAAVLALSQRLRADWRGAGVGVSAVCPGVIDTPILEHTRFLGEQGGDAELQERLKRLFRRGHKPELVAAAIVDAVEHDRIVVPVGFEARMGLWFQRLAPVRAQQALGRGGRG